MFCFLYNLKIVELANSNGVETSNIPPADYSVLQEYKCVLDNAHQNFIQIKNIYTQRGVKWQDSCVHGEASIGVANTTTLPSWTVAATRTK
jgi:hypothetical protein